MLGRGQGGLVEVIRIPDELRGTGRAALRAHQLRDP
jgi:hypothetical protein